MDSTEKKKKTPITLLASLYFDATKHLSNLQAGFVKNTEEALKKQQNLPSKINGRATQWYDYDAANFQEKTTDGSLSGLQNYSFRRKDVEYIYYLNYSTQKTGETIAIDLDHVKAIKSKGCKIVLVVQSERTNLDSETENEYLKLADAVITSNDTDKTKFEANQSSKDKVLLFSQMDQLNVLENFDDAANADLAKSFVDQVFLKLTSAEKDFEKEKEEEEDDLEGPEDTGYVEVSPTVETISFFANSHPQTSDNDNTKLRNFATNMADILEIGNTERDSDAANNLATDFALVGNPSIESLNNYIAIQIALIKRSIKKHPGRKPCYYLNISSKHEDDRPLISPESLAEIKTAIPGLFVTVVAHNDSVINDATRLKYLKLADAAVFANGDTLEDEASLPNLARISIDSNLMENLLVNPIHKTTSTSTQAGSIHQAIIDKIEAKEVRSKKRPGTAGSIAITDHLGSVISGEPLTPPTTRRRFELPNPAGATTTPTSSSIISVPKKATTTTPATASAPATTSSSTPAATSTTTRPPATATAAAPATATTAAPPAVATTPPKVVKSTATMDATRKTLRNALLIDKAATSKAQDQNIYPRGTLATIDGARYEASEILADSIKALVSSFIGENNKFSQPLNFSKNAIFAEAFKNFDADATKEKNGANKDRIYISGDTTQFSSDGKNDKILVGTQKATLQSPGLQFATFSGLCLAGDVFSKDNPPKMWGMNFSDCQLGTWEKPLDLSRVDPNVLDTMQFRDCDLTYVIAPENYVWKVSALIHKKPKVEGEYTQSKIALDEVVTKDGTKITHQVSDEAEYESPNIYFEKTIPNRSKAKEGASETKLISDMDGLDLAVQRYKPLNVVKDPVASRVGALDLAAGRVSE